MSTYAVSDIHGQYKTFARGLKEIGFGESDMLYVIGDVIDRGPDGIRLLRKIMKSPNMELLIGNHELMMLRSVNPDGKKICDGEDTMIWQLYNGGDATYKKYERLRTADRLELLEWLRNCLVMKTLDVGGQLFCLTHSYYKEGLENLKYKDMEQGDVWNIVWTSVFRDDWQTHGDYIYDRYEYTFVTGHVPVQRVRLMLGDREGCNSLRSCTDGKLFDIDGGCSYQHKEGINNGLLFLRLDDLETFAVPLV